MAPPSLDRITSIGRPLDPAYATNRAVLWLMAAAGAVAALVQVVRGDGGPTAVVAEALVGAAVVFGSWALTRELSPDDNPAAFVSAVLGFMTALAAGAPSLLLLFVTLLLARVVNRTVGLPARTTDSIAVTGMTLWAAFTAPGPLLGVVGALAFAGDAVLRDARRRQWVFAAVCLAGTAAASRGELFPNDAAPLTVAHAWLMATIALAYAAVIVRTRHVESVDDTAGAPLSPARVRAGMGIGLLVALQAVTAGVAGLEATSPVWCSLAGVALGRGGGWMGRRVGHADPRRP